MKQLYVLVLCLLLAFSPTFAQSLKKEQTEGGVKIFVDEALSEKKRISIHIKGEPIVVSRDGRGPQSLKRFSGWVTDVYDKGFIVEDHDKVLGDVRADVLYSQVLSIKHQPAGLFRLRKTGEVAVISSVYVALVPVVLVGVVLCPLTKGKVSYGCPR